MSDQGSDDETAKAKAEIVAAPPTAREQTLGCFIMVVLLGLLIFGVKSCFFSGNRTETDAKASPPVATPSASPTEPRVSGPSNTVVLAGAMTAVKRKLVDPDSARFRDVRAYPQSSGTTAVCGEVNARTRAGGYDGYQRFISAGTDQYTYLEREVDGIDTAWTAICR